MTACFKWPGVSLASEHSVGTSNIFVTVYTNEMASQGVKHGDALIIIFINNKFILTEHFLWQGSPTPRPQAGIGTGPHSRRWVSKASSVSTALPYHSHYHLSSASCQISGGIINVMLLNHPETIPLPVSGSVEKLSFMKPIPERLGTSALEVRDR